MSIPTNASANLNCLDWDIILSVHNLPIMIRCEWDFIFKINQFWYEQFMNILNLSAVQSGLTCTAKSIFHYSVYLASGYLHAICANSFGKWWLGINQSISFLDLIRYRINQALFEIDLLKITRKVKNCWLNSDDRWLHCVAIPPLSWSYFVGNLTFSCVSNEVIWILL